VKRGNGGNTSIPSKSEDLNRDYDTLPLNIRKILQGAPFCISASSPGLLNFPEEMLIKHIKDIMRNETLLAYGPDHPQARE
jgi:hypothetical protein